MGYLDIETEFTERRLKQIQLLKGTAYKIIDFVAQFEDELVKIWNKPKFVLKSNYVITPDIDRILDVEGLDAVFVGPADLSMSVGRFPNWSDEPVSSAMDAVIRSCESHDKAPVTLAPTPADVPVLVNKGFRFVALGSNMRYLGDGAKVYLKQVGRL